MSKTAVWMAGILCVATGLSLAETPVPAAGASTELQKYTVSLGPKTLAGVADNASGLTFCGTSKTLFVVQNKPTVLTELDLEGAPKRTIELKDFDDTEDVCWLGGNTFAVVEERRRNLVIAEIPPEAKVVDYAACQKYLIDPVDAANVGLEGVAYDPASKALYIVKEKTPKKIYKTAIPADKATPIKVDIPWDIEKDGFGVTDLSACSFDAKTGHILILSDESSTVIEATPEGKEVSRLEMKDGKAGLKTMPKQPEGIAIDDVGTLYICCEPNQFLVFKK